MALESPEAMIISLSKDVERLTATVHDNAILFRENQQALNALIAEMREHKAVDDRLYGDFHRMQEQVYGTGAQVGLVTHVHDLKGKVGAVWRVIWSFIGAVATGIAGFLVSGGFRP
jgi:hypothetical protein